MALYKATGIVLGSHPFEESGKLVTIFTRDLGKISVIAKGSKRPTSRFGGRLETFSLVEVLAAEGRNLDILSQVEVINSFQPLRENSLFLNLGFYFVRIIGFSVLRGQKNRRLFNLLFSSFSKLADGIDPNYVVKFFEINYLKVEGLYRSDRFPEDLIAEHLDKDIRWWKQQAMVPGL
ncbi:DNA repair protein RecO [candidate division WOR-1 bacterium RIFOXYA12_FULL_43_27]|uniref:DNA repair protein RecO n=1 Tax=candidate division WOR-1 bacterium RIFOXYC2_FULL_46_14 TaxID=1802587 RepID=A0A1F4U5L3_UNCSA|nr:MAG: DNA repair protein RecO [candidate division WOR-1 bacterium RIFOXYA12_FULL_43_27]OGC20413.1 MAG: DNA repair protein RecO [candidate division WOR-1 bacterium RIFOXYB2_FULL_46_45]OGC31850.1 MAG: DNA repair protein RecO [candidate division WOR-1 bacterium RIFOXYA2_FULL_46_56]OGC40258.1 MAG: DNA repair protein RecO [candidate division WOR-1 bacterium RIFOXYC2_FULL_46_14]